MFKWILSAFGVFMLWGAIDHHFNSDTLNSSPDQIGLERAKDLIKKNERRFISYRGNIDPQQKFYSTYLQKPKFVNQHPSEIEKIYDLTRDNLKSHQGKRVQIEMPVQAPAIEIDFIREEKDQNVLQSKVYLAPVAGTMNSLWVLSPTFSGTANETASKEWGQQAAHSGRLSSLSDLDQNVPNLGKKISEITIYFSSQTNQMMPSNAFVILENQEPMLESDYSRAKYYSPVVGTNNSLFVKLSEEEESRMFVEDRILGILTPSPDRPYWGFNLLLKEEQKIPQKIAIIHAGFGEQENKRNNQYTILGLVFGIASLILAVFLFKRSSTFTDR